jgi:nucleotide-binding universal stress UspA family protein
MKKILIAYDGTPGALAAIEDLRSAGLPGNSTAKIVTIADVWLPPAPPADDLLGESSWDRRYNKAADVLRSAKKSALEGACRIHELYPKWEVTNVARAGSPAREIIAEARRWNADLIVVGSHGRTPLERFFLGSVSHNIAADADCSVRIARPRTSHAGSPLRILAALDGSADSNKIVDELIGRNWHAGTKVDLVSVLDEKLKSTWVGRSDLQIIDSVEESVEALHKASLAKFTAQNISAAFHIMEGDPKDTLLKVASKWDVDSIFLGARGLDHGNRMYLGTLASAICSRAHCTVEVVR